MGGRTVASCALLWKDAVLIGVADTRRREDSHYPDLQHGLACDPKRVITEHDRVFMVSESVFPKLADVVSKPVLLPVVSQRNATPFDILVCGWRREWSDNVRLGHRIYGLACDVPTRSILFFLNLLTDDEFADCLSSSGQFHEVSGHWELKNVPGVLIKHQTGDAADLETLRAVMKRTDGNKFEAAIVMGTMKSVDLPPASRDMRVLSTIILLRKVGDSF